MLYIVIYYFKNIRNKKIIRILFSPADITITGIKRLSLNIII